jgi:hypothetical protein
MVYKSAVIMGLTSSHNAFLKVEMLLCSIRDEVCGDFSFVQWPL